ncbi:lysozyme inhibitor LprI family protein [Ferruginibacter sp.]|uniref:lysozyme inhibitor LprI family protein n=1 Tax=Ferruginibacter sp. TaxID=1940288 RepID=UPI00265A1A7E|nr:lysozyme inhibitor LprI family protein [Ferruginibacter sp.]
MKHPILFIVFILMCAITAAQSKTTAELEKKIKQEVEKEIPKLEQRLKASKFNIVQIEFTLDTFRIELLFEKHLASNFADFSMADATYETAKLYDSLLNKYYKKLLAALKGDDKKVLMQAQKNWIAFRDSEFSLVETISKEAYAGGGTMQQLTESSAYLNLVKSRTVAIFEHFTRATQNE